MSFIEGLGSAVGSVVGSVGKVGGGALEGGAGIAPVSGIGASLGAKFGPSLIGPESYTPTIINEGPVASSFLENNVTLAKFDPVGEIQFNSLSTGQAAIEPLQAPEALGIVEPQVVRPTWGAVVPQVEALAVSQAISRDVSYLRPDIPVSPSLEPETKTETGVSSKTAPATLTQPVVQQEQEIEEVVEEKMIKNETDVSEEEEIEKVKRKYVVDERALLQVVLEIKGAVRKAKKLAGKLGIKITGELIGKFIPGQNLENESEAVKGKGPDGSIPERQQAIEELGEFSSGAHAEERAVKLAYEKPPIKIRTEGAPVSNEDVKRVYKNHSMRPKTAVVEVVLKRIIKKKKLTTQLGQKLLEFPIQNQVLENKIEDHPQLEEVFQKAA